MAQEDLIPMNERTKEEQKELTTKGGIASGEARRKKKLMKKQIELLLSLPLKDEKAKSKFESLGIDADNIDNQMALIIAMWQQALKGGRNAVSAAEFLRDTVGEKPKDNLGINVDTSDKLKDVFKQVGGEGLSE